MNPRRSYLVCATERSGSTLLCELLAATGVAGRPEEFFEFLEATGRPRQPREYFEGVEDPALLDLLPPLLVPLPRPPWEQQLRDALERGTTTNGIFGSKLMWAYLGEFPDEPADVFPDVHWVHVSRNDKLAQAISLWRAIQTSQWRAEDRDASSGEPVYHQGAIAHLKRRLEEHDRSWDAWFAERGIEPHRVAYEDLSADAHAAVRGVLEHIGAATDATIPDPPLRRQADGRSKEWAERFLEESGGSWRRRVRRQRAAANGNGAATVSQLRTLEAEAIHIMREVAAELERPVLLFSGGKDSIVLLRLAEKAFRPGALPFPVMHVDTGHNFPEVIEFRDRRVDELGERLIVASVQESIDTGRVADDGGSRNRLQTVTLLDAIAAHNFDAAFGGARRDEERARAKERIFSFRDVHGQWDPRGQRPELWNIYNGTIARGEHVRVFPLSNWTELDVWRYIGEEELEMPRIYFAHEREVFERDGMLLATSEWLRPDGEEILTRSVRYRTVGDMTITGAVESGAVTVEDVIAETAATRLTERGQTRADDRTSEAAMEDRKREGYF
jgi:sulfate adenylyltransferase subunit 2